MRIDTHQHLWRFDPVEYDWIPKDATALRRDYLHADLVRELDASRIDASVAVQARQSLAENDLLLTEAEASGGRIRGVVGWVDLAAEDVDEVLDALSRGLTQKLLHGTLAELHASDGEQRLQLAQTVSRLFLRGKQS